MKALEQLTNVDRAKLLHQLFPQEIPAVIDFISGMCASIKEDEERNRQAWKIGLLTFDYWLHLLNMVESAVNGDRQSLIKKDRAFADQLFDGHLALYTVHCLRAFVTVRQHPNKKFAMAVEMLFDL